MKEEFIKQLEEEKKQELNKLLYKSEYYTPSINNSINRILIAEVNNIVANKTTTFDYGYAEDLVTTKCFEIKHIKEKTIIKDDMFISDNRRYFSSSVSFVIDDDVKKIEEIEKINISNLCVLVQRNMFYPKSSDFEGENKQFIYTGFQNSIIGYFTLLTTCNISFNVYELIPDKLKYNTINDFINHLLEDS